MKNLYILLFLACCSLSSAQNVSLDGGNFLTAVISTNCADFNNDGMWDGDADTNNDGYLQVSEALAVKRLDVGGQNIYHLTGITAFLNMEVLICDNNFFTSLDLSGLINLRELHWYESDAMVHTTLTLNNLPNLTYLNCRQSGIQNLDLTGTPMLNTLICENNSMISLNLPVLNNLKTLSLESTNFANIATTNLNALENLNISWNHLSTLDISNLPSLITLDCSVNNLTQLNLSNLSNPNLRKIYCNNNQITTLDLSGLPNLVTLYCDNNQLTTLDVSNKTALSAVGCKSNHLTSLNINGSVNLSYIDCSSNNLTSLDVANFTQLTGIYCGSNQLTSMDFTNLHKLITFRGENNPFTSLDFSVIEAVIPPGVDNITYGMTYYLTGCSSLVYLNIKTGVKFASQFNEFFNPLLLTGCTSLAYVCVNEGYESSIQMPNVQVNSYCFFNPGGQYNTITGKLTYDLNNNGCDAADTFSVNNKIRINNTGSTFTDAAGNYNFFIGAGSYTITPDFENPYFTVSPPSALVIFADINDHTETQNFCVTPNGIHNDVEISILPIQRPRPGFGTSYKLIYKNKGNQVLSGNIDFTFDDAVIDFLTANPQPDNQSLNHLNWTYADLMPFESRSINLTLKINSPMETPPVSIGDVLNFSAAITPVSGDETIADNSFVLSQTVVGSFDPNDKICLEGNHITPENIGNYLHYVIRFQNTGTDYAENVVVKDMLDTTKFDVNSLQLTGTSHPSKTKVTNNKIEFILEGINLPAVGVDEAGSHGFVAFKIKPKSNLVLGNSITNNANIYFDYNFPIVTNTATTTVALLGINAFKNNSVTIAPNPVQSLLHIKAKDNITSVQLFDVQGRLLETVTANETQVDFDLSQKANGIYFVKIYTVKGMKVEKVIKE